METTPLNPPPGDPGVEFNKLFAPTQISLPKFTLTSSLSFDNFLNVNKLLQGGDDMSNILGIIIGVVLIIVGLILLVIWWSMFIKALMAVVPILLVLIGIGLLVYFISEIKSKLEIGKEDASSKEK